jgi:hypothetical protein
MKSAINKKIDDALFDFYSNIDRNTASDLIQEEISDTNKYNIQKKRIEFLVKAQAKKKHNEELLMFARQLEEAINKNTDKPISTIKSNSQYNFSFAFYRNLESLSRNELESMIKDKNLIDILEDLEKKSNED